MSLSIRARCRRELAQVVEGVSHQFGDCGGVVTALFGFLEIYECLGWFLSTNLGDSSEKPSYAKARIQLASSPEALQRLGKISKIVELNQPQRQMGLCIVR